MSKRPVALIIMDGYGINPSDYGNAIAAAKKPNLDKYFAECPHTIIGASGLDVGLPDGQMGNSEVGHTNIGAGRIVYQMLVKISKDIKDGEFFKNKALVTAMENCKAKGSALHLMGLLSPGGVHSHMEHMYGLLEMAKQHGVDKVYVHAFLDGRDVPPSSAAEFMEEAVAEIKKIGKGKVALLSLEALELGVNESSGYLTCSVGAEVEEYNAVVFLYHAVLVDNGGEHELIGNAVCVGVLYSLNRVGLLNALAHNKSIVCLFNSVPSVITVHSVISA